MLQLSASNWHSRRTLESPVARLPNQLTFSLFSSYIAAGKTNSSSWPSTPSCLQLLQDLEDIGQILQWNLQEML